MGLGGVLGTLTLIPSVNFIPKETKYEDRQVSFHFAIELSLAVGTRVRGVQNIYIKKRYRALYMTSRPPKVLWEVSCFHM